MTFKKTSIALIASALLATTLSARDQIKIVGSSTVYPFSSSVAEELGKGGKFPTPVVESTGTGGGLKLFCSGFGIDTPDIANASRRIKDKELQLCAENGVLNISEALVGFDGIAIAQDVKDTAFNVSREQLALAVAEEVPSKDGKSLIKNPYKKWSDIDASLPNREIVVYGPPKSSGTRDSFEELVMQHVFEKMPVYTTLFKAEDKATKKYEKYSVIRTDGVYVESGENDNLIVQKLTKNAAAVGIFGYSFLEENKDKVSAVTVDKIAPTPETVSSAKYPIARSLYFYVKNSHIEQVPAIKEYVNLFMSEKMIGKDGILTEIGLIPLDDKTRSESRKKATSFETISVSDVKH